MLDKRYKHDISVVVDRLVMRHDVRKRLADSIETAVGLADGLVEIELGSVAVAQRTGADATAQGRARRGTRSSPNGARAGTLFTSPSASPAPSTGPRWSSSSRGSSRSTRRTGRASTARARLADGDRPRAGRARPGAVDRRGRARAVGAAASSYYEQVTEAIAERYGVDLDSPGRSCPRRSRTCSCYGTDGERVQVTYRNRYGRQRSYATRFEGDRREPSAATARRTRSCRARRSRSTCRCGRARCATARGCARSRARCSSAGTRIEDSRALGATRAGVAGGGGAVRDRRHVARLILREISERLRFLENVGIGYLSMDRGGRARCRAARRSGFAWRRRSARRWSACSTSSTSPRSACTSATTRKLIATLERLRDLGNTVIVVEHDEQTMRAADHLVDLGPGAGEHGGRIVAQGTAEEVEAVRSRSPASSSPASARSRCPAPGARRAATSRSSAPAEHNLRDIDVTSRSACSRCVTGVSGSGKSTLVNDVLLQGRGQPAAPRPPAPGAHRAIHGLEQLDKIIAVDQSPIGRTPRSNPATYTGLFDVIRDLFSKTPEARARGYKPGRFSFNVKGGRCEVCQRRRPDQDRDALPAGRVRAVRAVPRQALQPRDARGALQGQEHRRRARLVGRGGARVLRPHPEDPQAPGDAERGRASATSGSASRPRRCRAARRSG